jgi:hypothetical protein
MIMEERTKEMAMMAMMEEMAVEMMENLKDNSLLNG